MLFKSQVLTQASGSVGGLTYAHNRFGMYTRGRSIPVNPNSGPQQTVRSIFAALTAYWNLQLTAGQRSAWNAYASQVPMVNKLGDVIYVTGFNQFIRTNSLRILVGEATLDAAPDTAYKPGADPTFSVAISEATQNISVTFDNALDWAQAVDGHLIIFMGVPQMTNKGFYGGQYRYAGSIEGAVVPPTSPATKACPIHATATNLVWVRARILDQAGRVSDPFRDSCIVAV